MEAFIQSFIKAFGWSIMHSFWQGGIIYAGLFFIVMFTPKMSPAAKHNLSCLSVCAIFIWFVATFTRLWQTPEVTPAYLLIPPENNSSLLYSQGWSFANIELLFPLIMSVYLAGIFLQSFILYRGYRVLQNLRKTNLEVIPPEWSPIFYKVVARLNIKKAIDFHLSKSAAVPMVIGYFKPIILFPASLVTCLDAEQVEAILIHELTHIRRNDYLLNLIKTVIDTVLFFNPFIWLIGRFIRIEREHICDDMVLKYTEKPVKYAETLLQIELDKRGSIPTSVMAAISKKHYLLDRIKRISNIKTNKMNLKQQLAGVGVVIAAIFCLAWLAPSGSRQENKLRKESASLKTSSAKAMANYSITPHSFQDTIIPKKKQEVKIIVTDPDGKIKEYNSVNSLPDSLKVGIGMVRGKDFSFIADSLIIHGKAFRNQLNGVFTNPDFLESQKEIAKRFNSPEFKENMKKAFESFNSPEFKKEMEGLKQQYNSGKFKEQQEELRKNLNSAEMKMNQAEIRKSQAELLATLRSKELNENQQKLFSGSPALLLKGDHSTIKMNGKNLFITSDSVYLSNSDETNYRLFFNEPKDVIREKELEKNKEYQKLKKKFEKDVEKLKKKQATAEKRK